MTHYLFPNKEGKSVAIVYQNATIGAFVRDFFYWIYLYGNDCVAQIGSTKTLN
ncbi:hypothetical protein FORC11_3715 [Shigella sonnei]|nr:hypothetical protein FORC11_3715 [Shigella sonnei]EFZ50469.1 hypothetical protein SS53G_4996 [Shigella sonnei 53G]EIQ40038.1 hypothetical protein SS323385_4268 [Shigella sonnei 3233-85]EIQ50757.1 hypothetical protein SS482266_3839 [Shigella sonnei 4822-66]